MENRYLLIVEDSDEDFEITCWALNKINFNRTIIRAKDCEEALLYLFPAQKKDGLPGLVLLDLNLPGMSGKQLLQLLRRSESPPPVPVIILSTSSNAGDVNDCYSLGAAGYLVKPLGLEIYMEKLRDLTHYWFNVVTLPVQNYRIPT
ncbi:MAG: response regulator [Methylococcaceae bacterium]